MLIFVVITVERGTELAAPVGEVLGSVVETSISNVLIGDDVEIMDSDIGAT